MALQVQITRVATVGMMLRVTFNVIPSGSYVTGGDTLDFSKAISDSTFFGNVPYINSTLGPVELDVWDQGGNIANGVFPVLGSLQNNCKLKFTSAFNTELSAGAYPAAITGSKIAGEAIFTPNQ
jgi:hypothetical protein